MRKEGERRRNVVARFNTSPQTGRRPGRGDHQRRRTAAARPAPPGAGRHARAPLACCPPRWRCCLPVPSAWLRRAPADTTATSSSSSLVEKHTSIQQARSAACLAHRLRRRANESPRPPQAQQAAPSGRQQQQPRRGGARRSSSAAGDKPLLRRRQFPARRLLFSCRSQGARPCLLLHAPLCRVAISLSPAPGCLVAERSSLLLAHAPATLCCGPRGRRLRCCSAASFLAPSFAAPVAGLWEFSAPAAAVT